MDISINLKGIRLNIRTSVLIETESGYIFEKDTSDRFYWPVGGRIQLNETSEDAAKREIEEELGIKIGNIKLKAIMESFFVLDNEQFHEICFYYHYKMDLKINLPKNYYVFSKKEMENVNIQPKMAIEIINSINNRDNNIIHMIDNRIL